MLKHNQSDGIFLLTTLGQESEKEEEDNAITALMRRTDEEIETNCKLVRDVIESQRAKKEKKS